MKEGLLISRGIPSSFKLKFITVSILFLVLLYTSATFTIEHFVSRPIIYLFLWSGFMVTNYLVSIDLLNFMGDKFTWD